jgi:hypothetical protein
MSVRLAVTNEADDDEFGVLRILARDYRETMNRLGVKQDHVRELEIELAQAREVLMASQLRAIAAGHELSDVFTVSGGDSSNEQALEGFRLGLGDFVWRRLNAGV